MDDDTVAKVGPCQMGTFEIIDWEMRTVLHLPVMVDLPPLWRPPRSGAPPEELMADPGFIDHEHFQFVLPTGETRVYSICKSQEISISTFIP